MTSIRLAVVVKGDDWRQFLDGEQADAHRRNECMSITGSETERADFYRMKACLNNKDWRTITL